MAKLYASLIKQRKMTLSQVPEKWYDAVKEILEGS